MSPRPRKPRRCEKIGDCHAYSPVGMEANQLPQMRINSDELESLRLCDLQGMTQEQAGKQMGVSRGTVQRTVKEARRKIIEALLSGAVLLMAEDKKSE